MSSERRITKNKTEPREKSDRGSMPQTLPVWAIQMRQEYEATIMRLEDRISEMENSAVMTERAQASGDSTLALYGESEGVKHLTKRLMYILPNANTIGQAGVALVAQIAVAHGLDPMPGSDHVYAWKQGQRLLVTIGYKGLLHLAQSQHRFTHNTRPMTDTERAEHALVDGEIGYVTEVWVLARAAECKDLGIPYHPIVGTAVWKPRDNVPTARTPAWVAGKNSLKDALRQFARTGVRMQGVLDAQFQQNAMEWSVELPDSHDIDEQALIDAGIVPPASHADDSMTIDGEYVDNSEIEADEHSDNDQYDNDQQFDLHDDDNRVETIDGKMRSGTYLVEVKLRGGVSGTFFPLTRVGKKISKATRENYPQWVVEKLMRPDGTPREGLIWTINDDPDTVLISEYEPAKNPKYTNIISIVDQA